MSRILQSVFLIMFFSVQSFGQDPDTLSSTEYQDLIASDTIYAIYGDDTIYQHRDGVRVVADTTMVEEERTQSPQKAIMYALVLPGLGQAYNRKYFKMPIVWAAMGGAGWAISFNTKKYKAYSEDFVNDPENVDERGLQYWRRNMELSYIAMIAIYALQVVDAYVDAQLYSWDVTEELSMGISPSMQPLRVPGSLTGHAYGLTCSFNLKR